MKTLDRYLLKEMAGPFLFGVAAFVSLFVAGNFLLQLTDLMSQQGIGVGTVLLLFIYWLPRFLVLTFPMSVLLGVLLAYGRLSGESEITAMRAGGVPFRRLVAPAVAAGLLVSLVTIGFNELVTPPATRAYERLTRQIAKQMTGYDHFSSRVLEGDRLQALIYARQFDPAHGILTDVTYVRAVEGRPVAVVYAPYAKWDTGENDWLFYQGRLAWLVEPKEQEAVQAGHAAELPQVVVRFGDRPMQVHLAKSPEEIEKDQLRPEDMTWSQLRRHIAELRAQKVDVGRLQTRWHHKLSIPFASLIFALIGAPLALRSHRGSSSLGLGLSILIAFCYYVVWEYLATVAEKGMMDPLLAAWLPNLLGLAAGVVLVRRAGK